jgi:hypothetical protein
VKASIASARLPIESVNKSLTFGSPPSNNALVD